jgi:hypothetical protein
MIMRNLIRQKVILMALVTASLSATQAGADSLTDGKPPLKISPAVPPVAEALFGMKVDPVLTNVLVCTWWGGETGARNFDILIDGTKIASQTLLNNEPGKFWEAVYPIPADLTRGQSKITVKLQAQPGNFAGGLFGCRTLRVQNILK